MEKKEYRKKYYDEHKDEIRERSAKRYRLKKKEILEQHRQRHKKRPTEQLLLQRAKQRSKQFNIPFNLEIEDIIVPDKCPIFGFRIERNIGQPIAKYNSPSIDKILPELGYTKGNIQIISKKANVMKSNATPKELMCFANWIIKNNTKV